MKVSYTRSSVSSGSPVNLLFGVVFTIIGIGVFLFGVSDAIDSYSLDKKGVEIVGQVIEHTTSRGSKGRVNHHARTLFTLPSGESFEKTFSKNIRVGAPLPVLALKDKFGTWQAKEASFEGLYLMGLLMVIFGLCFVGIGCWATIRFIIRRGEINELNKFGKYIKAKISGVSTHTTKNSTYSIVHALSSEPLKGVPPNFIFDSEPIRGSVSQAMVGNEVEILVDRQNASSYLFEVSS